MQKFIDTQTEQFIGEPDIKARLAAPVERRKTILVPQLPIYDDEGNPTPQPDKPVEKVRSVSRTFSDLSVVTDEDLAEVNVARIEYIETPKPAVEPWQTLSAGPLDKSVPGQWRTTWLVNANTVADAVDKKLSELAAERWLYQTGGINVGGINIDSGNGTVVYVDTTLKKMESNPALVINWKTADGTFHQLNQTLLQTVADALFAHVQNAFAAEGTLAATVGSIASNEQLTDEQKLQQITAVQWSPNP